MSSWINENLIDTDERIAASDLRTEWHYDSMVDEGDAQDMIDDEAWREAQALFDGTHEDDEDPGYDPDAPSWWPEDVDLSVYED